MFIIDAGSIFGDVMALTEELNKEWNVLGMTGIRSGKTKAIENMQVVTEKDRVDNFVRHRWRGMVIPDAL